MGKKCKCPKPKVELTAPFYMLTYGDLMTLLLTFFVLLFSMATIQTTKFQAQVGIMQGALGISKLYEHAPMQEDLPAPAIKKQLKIIAKTEVPSPQDTPAHEISNQATKFPSRHSEDEKIQALRTLGMDTRMQMHQNKQEIVIVIPTYGLFSKGEWKIDPSAPELQRVAKFYKSLADQIGFLTHYDINFVGHTDAIPVIPKEEGPKNNMELGFLRALEVYNYFFADTLTDKSRIAFASQGDNVPLVPDATVDSERRKNRRVEIHLKKKELNQARR
jgi:chemotaxis protein MotB